MHPVSTLPYKRYHYRWLKSDFSTAHESFCLPLLPSGSDGVHKFSLRGTRFSTPLLMVRPHKVKPQTGNSTLLQRIAGYKTPLSPHLARQSLTGGEKGIRTPGRVAPTHAFQACSLNQLEHLSTNAIISTL